MQLRKWRREHPGKSAEYQRRYFERDQERLVRRREWNRAYYARYNEINKERRREWGRRAWARLRERLLADPTRKAILAAYNKAYAKAWRRNAGTAKVVANWQMREFVPPAFANFYPLIVGELTASHPIMRALENCTADLFEDIRDDVRQELLLAVIAGDIQVADLRTDSAKVRSTITQVRRSAPSRFGPISLDAPSPWSESGELTLLDRLAIPDEVW